MPIRSVRGRSIRAYKILNNLDTRRQYDAGTRDKLEILKSDNKRLRWAIRHLEAITTKARQDFLLKTRRLEAAKRAGHNKQQQFKHRFAAPPPSNHDLRRNSYVDLLAYSRKNKIPGAYRDIVELCAANNAVLKAEARTEEARRTLQARHKERQRARQKLMASDFEIARLRQRNGNSTVADEGGAGLVPGIQSLRLDHGAVEELCGSSKMAPADTVMVV